MTTARGIWRGEEHTLDGEHQASETADQLASVVAEAFQAARVMTRCLRRSETIVCLAIERVSISRLYSRDLLAETVQLSAADAADFTGELQLDAQIYLPSELQAVLHLHMLPRCSFVARVLLGFSLDDCVQFLRVDATEITLALLTAIGCICSPSTSHTSEKGNLAIVSTQHADVLNADILQLFPS